MLKLAAADGATLWETEVDAGGGASFSGWAIPTDIEVDAADNPIVAVNTRPEVLALPNFTVIKFARLTGTEQWRYQLAASPSSGHVPFDLAVVGADVVAVGSSGGDGWVVRLAGASGAVVWDHRIDKANVRSVAIDSAGDVAVGLVGLMGGAGPFAIAKLAGASGATLWTSPAPSPEHAVYQIAVDANDDIVGAGLVNTGTSYHAFVTKRAGGDGSQIFLTPLTQATVNPSINYDPAILTPPALFLALDPGGKTFVTANAHDPLFRLDLRVWRIGSAGAIDWTTLINGAPVDAQDYPVDLVVAAGDPIIAASLGGGRNTDFAVIELDGAAGQCSGLGCLLHLTIGVIKIGEKFQKKWLWGMTASGNPLTVPPAETADDPRKAGAIVTLSNPATGERAVFTLPGGANWTALGSRTAPDKKGYLYVDKEGRNGPCSLLKLTPGKKLKLKCKAFGSTPPFSLDEKVQGALDVQLQIGSVEYCLSTVGGEVVQDRGVAPSGKRGLFKVRKAPPPESCP